jgi:DNA polymerase I-like protein with 3'-5' exonuclease and polymerase domains
MREQYEFQMSLLPIALKIGLRGFNIDHEYKSKISNALAAGMRENLSTIEKYLGHPFNPRSHPAMKKLFYEDLHEKPVFNRKTKGITVDDTALVRMKARSPLLRPLIEQIQEYRSRGVFKSTFADARCSPDGRMRTSVNLTGTETFRFSTSEAYDGSGTNLQNISKGTDD